MSDDLYLRIKLQGLGWGDSAKATENDYIVLMNKIADMLSQDKRFIGDMKTATIELTGYALKTRSMLVKD